MKFKHLLFFILLFSVSIIALYPQEEQPEEITLETSPEATEETPEETTEPVSASLENENTVYVIREINFDIDGRTRQFALLMNSDLVIGEHITGKANFDKYLSKQRQTLNNQRVLDEVKIEYFTGEIEEDGALAISLLVHVKDSWNFIVIPYPKYDSNSGWSITLKARDYNFFGTMNTLFFDFGYQYDDTNNDHIFNIAFGTEFPFQALGLNWSVRLDNTFTYTVGDPLYYRGIAGLSVKLPWHTTTFTVGFNQYLIANEDNSDENKKAYSLGDIFEGVYGATELYASWRIPINFEVGPFGKLYYTPRIAERINYPYGEMDESRKPVTRLSHSLSFGRMNWVGNYRKGLNASVSNAFNIYADRSDAPFYITLNGEAVFHWPFNKYIGISSRLKYRQWWHWSENRLSVPNQGYGEGWRPNHSAGDVLRGIIDDDIWANYMLSLNIDLPIRVLRFWPSEWFNNNKLRLFNFEMHLSPFLDLALVEGPYSRLVTPHSDGIRFRLDDMLVTTGIEVLVYPAFFRSIYIRASIGYDLKKIAKDGLPLKWGFFPEWNEIFIGLDHYY